MKRIDIEKTFTYRVEPLPERATTIKEAILLFGYSLNSTNNGIKAPTEKEADEFTKMVEELLIKVLTIRLKLEQVKVLIDKGEKGEQPTAGEKDVVLAALNNMIIGGKEEIKDIDAGLTNVGAVDTPLNKLQ